MHTFRFCKSAKRITARSFLCTCEVPLPGSFISGDNELRIRGFLCTIYIGDRSSVPILRQPIDEKQQQTHKNQNDSTCENCTETNLLHFSKNLINSRVKPINMSRVKELNPHLQIFHRFGQRCTRHFFRHLIHRITTTTYQLFYALQTWLQC